MRGSDSAEIFKQRRKCPEGSHLVISTSSVSTLSEKCNFPDMTTARSISRVDSTVEMGIVNKVEMDGVVYRDPTGKCYLLDKVLSENKSSVILVFAFAFPSSLFS